MTERSYPGSAEAIVFWYKNYRGETGYRRAIPISIRFGVSDWHKEPQWLLLGIDTDKEAEREFALKDISAVVGFPTIGFGGVAQKPGASAESPQHVADYLFDQTSNLGAAITYTACLAMARHIQAGQAVREPAQGNPSTANTVDAQCPKCNGTKRATYFSEQA